MVNKYEGVVILDATLSDENKASLIEKFSKMASEDVVVNKWGVKKLAYKINHKQEGYYVQMNFSADNTVVEKISKLMNITTGVMRYMFIKLDDKKTIEETVK